jgi:hypothetical protein
MNPAAVAPPDAPPRSGRQPSSGAGAHAAHAPTRRGGFVLPAIAAIALLVATPAGADPRDDATPTGWWHYYGATEPLITNLINTTGARLVDLEAEEGTNPQTFTASFVPNSGVHAVSGWWWYYGVTVPDIVNFLNANQARLIDLRRYTVGGQDRFTCVMVRNTGSEAKAWWWYVGQTTAQVSNLVATNNARLVSLSSYVSPTGGRLYDVVMISNTGADASAWWWYFGVTGGQVSGFINENQARLYDWEVYTEGGVRKFNVVMLPNTGASGVHWWWYYDTSVANLVSLVNQNGARIFDIESYEPTPGNRIYGALMLNNSNALTTRIAGILGYGEDGSTGCYLKQVNGPVLASLQQDFVFEPASTIKGLIALHFMREVDAGNLTMGQSHQVFTATQGSCPLDANPIMESHRSSLFKMLKNSDNNHTQAFVADFGIPAINTTAAVLGMNDSGIHHRLGCGADAIANPNELTLANAGLMYESIFTATALGAAWRDSLRTYLVNETNHFPMQTMLESIVDDEATQLGLPASAAAIYKDRIRYAYKAGSYGLCSPGCRYYYSVAGWAQIPGCGRGSDPQFVFGTFVHGAVDEATAGNKMWTSAAELFREQVRDGLRSCPLAVGDLPSSEPGIALAAPHPNPARRAAQLRFTLPVAGEARLTVHDLAGREVSRLVEGTRAAGEHLVTWETANVAPGVYFVRLSAGGRASSRRMVVIR